MDRKKKKKKKSKREKKKLVSREGTKKKKNLCGSTSTTAVGMLLICQPPVTPSYHTDRLSHQKAVDGCTRSDHRSCRVIYDSIEVKAMHNPGLVFPIFSAYIIELPFYVFNDRIGWYYRVRE